MKIFDQLLDGKFGVIPKLGFALLVAGAVLPGCSKTSLQGHSQLIALPAVGDPSGKVQTQPAILPLTISPVTPTIYSDQTVVLSATGGTAPYTYALLAGEGSVNGSVYTPGSDADVVFVQVTDAAGNTDETSITVIQETTMQVLPANPTIAVNSSVSFTVSGGTAPYSYSLLSGTGSLAANVFTAPASAETDQISVTDAAGQVITVTITVSADTALRVSPASPTVRTGSAVNFTVTGGTAPYAFALVSGNGSVSSNVFTAPASAETDQISVTDSLGESIVVSVNVVLDSAMSISPANPTLNVNASIGLTTNGGTGPYAYSVHSGHGSFNGNVFTASSVAETDLIEVTDSLGEVFSMAITVSAPPETPIYQYWNYSIGDQMPSLQIYKIDVAALGYVYGGVAFNLYSNTVLPYMHPIYRCYVYGGEDHFISTLANCEGQVTEELLGYASMYQTATTTPLYRFFNYHTAHHLFTTNYAFGVAAGYTLEGVLGYVPVN